MALTTVATDNQVDQWAAKYFTEYLGFNQFAPYMGTDPNSIIQVNEELGTKAGKSITVSLVTELSNTGVSGNGQLEGSEVALGNYGQEIAIADWANAVAVHKADQRKTVIDLLGAARPMLMSSHMTRLRERIITELGSIDGVDYGTATEGEKDTWATNNSDRILYGDAIANDAGGDQSASLTNITAGMTLDAATLLLLKRIAKSADPKIRPYQLKERNNEQWYVAFTTPQAFRDLAADTTIVSYHENARPRAESNPLYRDGDIVYRGIIVREVEEIATLGTVGAGGTVRVDPVYVCGAQAVGWAIGQRVAPISETRDYGRVRGVGVDDADGLEKLRYNSKDHGIVTGYVAAAAD